ncbi:MAG: glycosyltransferase family 2 protein, partial [Pseudomonadota bacterium]
MFDELGTITDLKALSDRALARHIYVVIPTFNEGAFIQDTLFSLMTGSEALAEVEFVVMDGGSTDQTKSHVQALCATHPNLTLQDNLKKRQAAAVNKAAAQAGLTRDILIRCDAHAVYPPNFVLNVARRLIKTQADSLVVPMDAMARPEATAFGKANAMVVDTPLGSGGAPHRGGTQSGFVDHGHHAGFWRDTFLSLGGYNENMIANEDAEYDTRLRAQGGRIWLEADLRIGYYPRETVKALWRQYFAYGRGRAEHIRRHRVPPRLRQCLPVIHTLFLLGFLCLLPLSAWGAAYP